VRNKPFKQRNEEPVSDIMKKLTNLTAQTRLATRPSLGNVEGYEPSPYELKLLDNGLRSYFGDSATGDETLITDCDRIIGDGEGSYPSTLPRLGLVASLVCAVRFVNFFIKRRLHQIYRYCHIIVLWIRVTGAGKQFIR
jgi:hypothetical protein